MIINREFSFEAAHVLSNYNGACNNLHGHSYFGKIEICLTSAAMAQRDMLIDFNQLKKVIATVITEQYDHRTIFATPDQRDNFERELYELCVRHHKKVVVVQAAMGGRSTCEVLCRNITADVATACKNINILGDSDFIVRCYLHETAGSECISEWTSAGNEE